MSSKNKTFAPFTFSKSLSIVTNFNQKYLATAYWYVSSKSKVRLSPISIILLYNSTGKERLLVLVAISSINL